MARHNSRGCGLILVAALAFAGAASPAEPILRLSGTTELPGVEGDMDHLAVDEAGQRLFVAAEDNGTLRVIDLKTGKLLRTLKGFATPHSVLYLADQAELYLTDRSAPLTVLDTSTFQGNLYLTTT